MKRTTSRVRKNGSAASPSRQAKTSVRPPAEFKLVRLRDCPVDSPLMDNPDHIEKFWREHIAANSWFNSDKECAVVFLLNTRRRLLGFEMLSQGTKDSCLFGHAEVFRLAAIQNAAAIVLAHNHPSGDPSPSDADIRMTREIRRAGELIKVDVVDHVIIGSPAEGKTSCRSSLRELGYFGVFEDAAETTPNGREEKDYIGLSVADSKTLRAIERYHGRLPAEELLGFASQLYEQSEQLKRGAVILRNNSNVWPEAKDGQIALAADDGASSSLPISRFDELEHAINQAEALNELLLLRVVNPGELGEFSGSVQCGLFELGEQSYARLRQASDRARKAVFARGGAQQRAAA